MWMAHLITTLGRKSADQLTMILPHEHVFVDLRTPDQPGYAQADTVDVIRLMAPEIARAHAVGVTAIVDCAPIGVGRRADILREVSVATGMPLVVPTGIYREPWVPAWAHSAGEDELCDWMRGELDGTIEQSGVQAGFIKLSAGDEGLTDCETKILRAAARAAAATGAVIGSHTIRGRVVHDQLAIIEAAGYTSSRFIWIHASAEPDIATNIEIARRGAWIEYDWIGDPSTDDAFIDRIRRLLDAGLERQILLSQDRGWYDPAQPGGGTPKPYTYLSEHFLPKLRAAGVAEQTIRQLTVANPFSAFAR
jgi:phosphotriesterase-related protein